jgi:hypothetical protein
VNTRHMEAIHYSGNLKISWWKLNRGHFK